MELEETKIGRLDHKIEKLQMAARAASPASSSSGPRTSRGDNGLTLTEYAPFGVIGAITPVTHSLPTLAGNAINMLAAGNTIVANPHPSGREGRRRGGPPLQQGDPRGDRHRQPDHDHRPADAGVGRRRSSTTARSACWSSPAAPPSPGPRSRSKKRAIVAGPGNPPVVVDETAASTTPRSRSSRGGSYDNNLLCIGEKQVFAVADIFDKLMDAIGRTRRLPPRTRSRSTR